jgi:hypothetical protein
MAKLIARVAALLLCGSLGALLVPGCVIRIGPGTGEDTSTDPTSTEGEPDGTDNPNEAGMTPEEQAALESFESVDPDEFRFKTAATIYAASACASLVESRIPDPDAVDLETVSALFEQYAPIAVDEAMVWLDSVDPSVIPVDIKPDFSCRNDPYRCPDTVACSFGSEPYICWVTQCGKGPCPWCPFLDSLVYKHYCVYGCTMSDKLVGGAIMLKTRFGNSWNGPRCIYFGK